MSKKLVTDELENVSGGQEGYIQGVRCSNCCEFYDEKTASDIREAGSGCSKYYEFQCPKCGTWNRG